ncbi:hypothetical protein C4D60_Mb01t06180 [Musa balbisiana]|uniref:YABBY protein C-terminal domain-containing protein n=1 Tax=Musa balbisiana TaxID=52838 RepID=A0A4S8JK73_MUSBA|nr:hypothetical protein C4D60_Mb01t06180 [Musa balbisiana]
MILKTMEFSAAALSDMERFVVAGYQTGRLQKQATEKRRVPSAYNKFIKEEIRRLKAKDPDISHKEAFSTAAKNWAHFPEIHFGPSVKGSKQV